MSWTRSVGSWCSSPSQAFRPRWSPCRRSCRSRPDQQPGVERRTVEQLARLDFIARGTNVVLIGPTGVGKTGIASAILLKALHQGHRGLFIKAQELLDRLRHRCATPGSPLRIWMRPAGG